MSFTKKDYDEILREFEALADEEYRRFQERIVPGGNIKYGVRMPDIKRMGKAIAKNDAVGFLNAARYDSTEETLLRAYVIAIMKTDIETRLSFTKDLIPHISTWAECDTFCMAFKPHKAERDRVWEFIQPYFDSEEEYSLRFPIVMFLANYIDEGHIDAGLQQMERINHDAYYVKMAVAWAVSICFIKFRSETLELIKKQTLDKFTQNKAIQKIRESYRVSDKDKNMLLEYKLK